MMNITIIEILFWASAGACAYVYFGYPLLVYVLGLFKGRNPAYEEFEPRISIIIAAYNEEKHIREKLENTLSLRQGGDYRRLRRFIGYDSTYC
jgi:cellulose synthase/poly-beta-1,6-N-acetylglucosamine synthase-like glycosyltransferase